MKNTVLSLSTAAALVAASLVSSSARAEDASLHLSAGASEVAHAANNSIPDVLNNNRFRTGMDASAKLLFPIIPNLAVGPSTSVHYFTPSNTPNAEASVLWDFGGTVRLQGAHTSPVVPYIDASGSVDKHGSVWNPSMGASAGIDFALDATHTYAAGVYVAWDHVFQTNTAQERQSEIMDHHDVNTVSAGLSLSFDYPVKPVHTTTTNTVVETRTVVQPAAPARTVVQTVQVPVPTSMTLPMTVQFAKDSAVVDAAGQDVVGQVATAANDAANADTALTVEGYASMEGDTVYNLVLSQKRAAAVVELLAAKGVARSRLSVVSVGAVGAANDASNRKVDFVVHIAQQ